MQESEKLRSSGLPFVFVFITDEAKPVVKCSGLDAVILSRVEHSAVLGDVLAHIRKLALADWPACERAAIEASVAAQP